MFSPDGRMVVTGSSDATLKFWDVRDGSLLRSRRAHLDSVNAIALSGDGKILVSGGSDKMVKIWQVADLL